MRAASRARSCRPSSRGSACSRRRPRRPTSFIGIGRISTGLGLSARRDRTRFPRPDAGVPSPRRASASTSSPSTIRRRRPTHRRSSSRCSRRPPIRRAPAHRRCCSSAWRAMPGCARRSSPRTSSARRRGRCARARRISQYWTGRRAREDTLGKFTFVPIEDVNTRRDDDAGPHVSDRRLARASEPRSARRSSCIWIPFLDEARTPLEQLTRAVGGGPPRQSRPGHVPADRSRLARGEARGAARRRRWARTRQTGSSSRTTRSRRCPATEYTAARALAYRKQPAASAMRSPKRAMRRSSHAARSPPSSPTSSSAAIVRNSRAPLDAESGSVRRLPASRALELPDRRRVEGANAWLKLARLRTRIAASLTGVARCRRL